MFFLEKPYAILLKRRAHSESIHTCDSREETKIFINEKLKGTDFIDYLTYPSLVRFTIIDFRSGVAKW